MEKKLKQGESGQELVEGNPTLPAKKFLAPPPLEEVTAAYKAVQRIEGEVLSDDDYVWVVEWTSKNRYGHPKEQRRTFGRKGTAEAYIGSLAANLQPRLMSRKKRSAFRKMGLFFNLTMPSWGEPEVRFQELGDGLVKVLKGEGYLGTVYMQTDFSVVRAHFSVEVRAANGRTMKGEGGCSASERGFTHPDHDIVATAFTRALSRAISDIIGWGEVSAEDLFTWRELGTPAKSKTPAVEGKWKEVKSEKEAKVEKAEAKKAKVGEAEVKKAEVAEAEPEIENLAQLISKIFELGLTLAEAEDKVGKPVGDLAPSEFNEAYAKIASKMQ